MVNIEGLVKGASSASRLVLFLRFENKQGLYVATNEVGEPQLPRFIGDLPPPTSSRRGSTGTSWQANFFAPFNTRVEEIFVVVCEVRQRPKSTPENDYKSFRYLPFRDAEDIDMALELLRDYGWQPTGFTRITP